MLVIGDKMAGNLIDDLYGKSSVDELRNFTFRNGTKPDAIIMLFTNNLIDMIRLLQHGKAKGFLTYTDGQIMNYMKSMQHIIDMPMLAEDLNLDKEDIEKKMSSIESAREYLNKKTADKKRVYNIDEKILRYPLLCLINSLQNIRKIDLVDIDMYVCEIYRVTAYRYQRADMDDTPTKKDVLDQIGKERREIWKRHKNELMFVPPEIEKREKED